MIMLKIFILSLVLQNVVITANNIEARLWAHVFQNYSLYVRPVNKTLDAIMITFHMSLRQVIQINERAQTLTAQADFIIEWKNEFLQWNPKEWGGVDTLYASKEQVWTPVLTILNNAQDKAPEPHKGTDQVILGYDGNHKWYPIFTVTVSYKNNIRYFPFDLQRCTFMFESWILDETKLRLKKADYSQVSQYYLESPEWHINKVEKHIYQKYYDGEVNAYDQMHFTYFFLRKPNYYVISLILPCILLLLIILFSHFLPPASGERMGVVITILLAFAVFLEVVSSSMPPNSDDTSVLSMFYLITMTLCALSFLATCIVITVTYHEKTTYPPTWIRKYILRSITKTTLPLLPADIEVGNCVTPYYNEALTKNEIKHDDVIISETSLAPDLSCVISHLQQIIKLQNEHFDLMKNESVENKRCTTKNDQDEDILREWEHLAVILDRISFWVFLFLFIAFSLGILVPAYEKYHNIL